jgi:hypothetical protein
LFLVDRFLKIFIYETAHFFIAVIHLKVTAVFNDLSYTKKSKLEAQWAEPVSLTFHSALRKLNTERYLLPQYHLLFPIVRVRVQAPVGSNQKTIILVFAASTLSTQL